MQLSKLFNDDRAVSPVIGVILMVAITVILAAVIGTFVLGLGDSISDTTPSASISEDIEYDGTSGDDTDIIFIHQSGENIQDDNLRITDSGDGGFEGALDDTHITLSGGDDVFSAGDSITTNGDANGNDGTVRLVFDSGSTSSTLASIDYESQA